MKYPYILSPKEHRLDSYYERLNRYASIFWLAPLIVNELFIRPYWDAYQNHPDNFFSMFAFTLNAQASSETVLGLAFYFFIPVTVCFGLTFLLLPRWSSRDMKRKMNSGLPPKNEYATSYYYFQKSYERMAFFIWHFVLMRISFSLLIFVPTMAINLFRR